MDTAFFYMKRLQEHRGRNLELTYKSSEGSLANGNEYSLKYLLAN